jgi:hypothetical protein
MSIRSAGIPLTVQQREFQTMSIRSKAQAYLNGFPHSDVTSLYQGGLFTRYTGLTHQHLIDKWKTGSFETSCNAFVGIYGGFLGAKLYLGDFWIDATLAKKGLGHAWVPAASGKLPMVGDTFYVNQLNPGKGYNTLHTGVVVSASGGVGNTIEGGQGGPGMTPQTDIIKRKSELKNGIKGWVNIDALFPEYSRPEIGVNVDPAPEWLVGWWQVSWQGNTYYYHFDNRNTVTYSKQGIRGQVSGTGNFQMNGASLTVNWPASGTVERFGAAGPGSMHGLWNGTEQIFATFLRP